MSTRTATQLYIVAADYRCERNLAGHGGCSYASPPQPAVQARALVRMLLNCAQEPLEANDAPWRRAGAGGTLTIRSSPATPDGQLTL